MDINLRGTLCDNETAEIYRYFGWSDITCPADITAGLESCPDGEDITLLINSPGGDMTAGAEIASILRRCGRKCMALIQGYAASAATIAMCGCGDIASEPAALLCYHNPSMAVEGDFRDMTSASDELKNAKISILDIYQARFPSMNRDDVASLMNKDIFISPSQALEYHLIDRVIDYTGDEAPAGIRFAASVTALPMVTPAMREAYNKHVSEAKETEAKNKAAEARWKLRRGI